MKFMIYLLLGTACLLHAAHAAPLGDVAKRVIAKAAVIALILGAMGYYGLALIEFSGIYVDDARASGNVNPKSRPECDPGSP